MAKRGRYTAPHPRKPADAASAIPALRKFMVNLFEREDGKAADWPLIAETLLTEAFHALDHAPGDPRVPALLRRAEGGVYNRLVGNADETARLSYAPAPDLIGGQAPRPGHDLDQ